VVLAQEDEPERHIIRGFAGYLSSSGGDTLDDLGDVELDNTAGFGLGYEFKFSPLIGLAFDYSWYGPDVKAEDIGDASADFNPMTLGLMFHFIHGRVVDFYAGPAAAYIDYGSNSDVDIDKELTWDARIGLDIKIFKWFGVGLSVEYIDATADFESDFGDGSLDVSPLVTKLGATFRF
jgi:outer membrane protein W